MNKFWLLIPVLIGVTSHDCYADDDNKLDAILRELKELRSRIEVLEKKLERQTTAVKVVPIRAEKNRRIIPAYPMPSKEVEDVIRLQFENSGELLEGIHDRERRLRQRIFFPEVF